MSLAPVRASQPMPTLLTPTAQRSPPTTEPAPRSADEWQRQINAELEGSLTYQVIKRMLLKSEDNGQTQTVTDTGETVGSETQTSTETAVVINIELSVSISMQIAIATETPTPQKSDPLVIDLGHDGIVTSGLQNGIQFDLNADGVTDRMSSVQHNDYFLALDRNGNQRIDDGRELFGDQGGYANGFEALRVYDDNHDQVIDQSDRVFNALRLVQWRQDGQLQQLSLSQAGIRQLNLAYQQTAQLLRSGDEIAQQGSAVFVDGQQTLMADVLLQYQS